MAIVYRHIRIDTEQPFYIGIGKNLKRAYSKYSRSQRWKSIVNKYGYEVEILFDDLLWEDAIEKEKEFISLYGRLDINTGILVNMTDGGDGSLGVVQSEESKEKRRIWSKNRVITEETKKKLSEKQIGEKNHMYGRKGKLNPIYGIIRSEETKKKLSEVAKNRGSEKNPMYGRNHSEETKEKIRQKRLNNSSKTGKKVGAFKDNVLIKEYSSLTQAVKETNGNLSCISSCCNQKMKTSGGYEWKFL
jgi:group I intron endonuclease